MAQTLRIRLFWPKANSQGNTKPNLMLMKFIKAWFIGHCSIAKAMFQFQGYVLKFRDKHHGTLNNS
ncbi:MAG TPA: hypothetical protein DDW62_10065 [Marinilabiliaceae bacterium]|nr:hypothetical protein [Marinilabiliaceae bacterium]